MIRFIRTAIHIALILSVTVCCAKTDLEGSEDPAIPRITFGNTEPIPAAGIENGCVEMTIADANGRAVKVSPDGKVVTAASCTETAVIFSVSENTGSDRTGYVVVSCGKAAEILRISQKRGTVLHRKSGWYELPEIADDEAYIYFTHDKLPSSPDKRNYSFCFAPEHYAAIWVAYPLHKCYTGSADRRNSFGYDIPFSKFCDDPRFEYQAQVTGAYYTNRNDTNISATNLQYSRGHQLPSADRTASAADNDTSFFATNMTPQLQALNGGAWQGLETLVREKWICSDTLYVVTGALFDEGHPYAYDNKSQGKRVSVPTHYYKALLRTKSGISGKKVSECRADELQCIGFIFAHDTSRSSQKVYRSDACSISALEQRTKLRFFTNVPSAPKDVCDTSLWSGLQ
ncbi:MAG: DNA/RNA non-specific endonuclease [Alistipes sp.]|nr:DNA/RNA non-specific endonuclease [Alistipes sp.]